MSVVVVVVTVVAFYSPASLDYKRETHNVSSHVCMYPYVSICMYHDQLLVKFGQKIKGRRMWAVTYPNPALS